MSRLKTFLIYVLIIITFFIVSLVLERGLIENMYYNMTGKINNKLDYSGKNVELDINVTEAKSTNVNGVINFSVTNNSDTYIREAYVKILLYSKSDVLAITKYIEINSLSQGETKNYTLRFKGSYIKSYDMSLEKEFPNKEYIINFFGYEFNTKDIFGIDLSKYINKDTLSSFGSSIIYTVRFVFKSIPAWGWFLAWTIVAGVW